MRAECREIDQIPVFDGALRFVRVAIKQPIHGPPDHLHEFGVRAVLWVCADRELAGITFEITEPSDARRNSQGGGLQHNEIGCCACVQIHGCGHHQKRANDVPNWVYPLIGPRAF